MHSHLAHYLEGNFVLQKNIFGPSQLQRINSTCKIYLLPNILSNQNAVCCDLGFIVEVTAGR